MERPKKTKKCADCDAQITFYGATRCRPCSLKTRRTRPAKPERFCLDCGASISRYGDTVRCAPCAYKAKTVRQQKLCADCGAAIHYTSTYCKPCGYNHRDLSKCTGRPPGAPKPPRRCECGAVISGHKATTCRECSYKKRRKQQICSGCGESKHFLKGELCGACKSRCPICHAPRTVQASKPVNTRPCRECIRKQKYETGYKPPHKISKCECGASKSPTAYHCKKCYKEKYAKTGIGCRVDKSKVGEYIYVPAPPGHPARTKSGRIAEHRLVMERLLGRYLLPHGICPPPRRPALE